MFRRPGFWRYAFFRPTMPFGPPMVKEMMYLVILWTISEESEGLTGYELMKTYGIKRSNVYRSLKELEEELGYLISEEKIVDGRAQRLYKITEKGKSHLSELRENWTRRIAFLMDITPPPPSPMGHHHPPYPRKRRSDLFIDQISKFKTKEETLAFIQNAREHFKGRIKRYEKRIDGLKISLKSFDDIESKINQEEKYNPEEITQFVKRLVGE
ncbi:MAG: PadR family transcriptional regulator [Asgard group archaeon]|nr:PadR family transcriptional regulator [Asgard group archaeon]